MENAIGNQSNLIKQKKDRIWELDFIRGACVLLMIFDHFMYDIADIFAYEWYMETKNEFYYDLYNTSYHYYFELPLRQFVEPLVVIIFCVVCGISCSFSRSNLKRGIKIGVFACLITLVTTLLEVPIIFGIFHMFTVAILFWCLLDFICKHDKIKTAIVCGIIGITIIVINYILMSFYNKDPYCFTNNSNFFFIGEFLMPQEVNNHDYQPIFPLVGYMLIGAALGPIIYKNKKSLLPKLGKYDWYAPINMWGKIAMWVYVFHQIIIGAILAIISFLFITPGNLIII